MKRELKAYRMAKRTKLAETPLMNLMKRELKEKTSRDRWIA